MIGTSPRITSRAMASPDDWQRVRDLLRETYPITPTGFNWNVQHWDSWRYATDDPAWPPPHASSTRLWETAGGKLVGAVFPEEAVGDANLQIHPDARPLIEAEMIDWAEEHLAAPTQDGSQRQIFLFAYSYDAPRLQLLAERGYEQLGPHFVRHRRFGDWPIPERALPEGYVLRNTRMDDAEDCQRIAELLNVAFNRDFSTPEKLRGFATHAPSFRQDLDMVILAPDGTFASYVGMPYDSANRHGIFEPVCTHPDHRRKGLAQTLMFEGLRRLKTLGALDVCVESANRVPANTLYDSIGFTAVYRGHDWRKVLD